MGYAIYPLDLQPLRLLAVPRLLNDMRQHKLFQECRLSEPFAEILESQPTDLPLRFPNRRIRLRSLHQRRRSTCTLRYRISLSLTSRSMTRKR
jgi:hypothetical protein